METTSINLGLRPATFQKWQESERNAIQLAVNAIKLKLSAIIERTIGAALTHRTAIGGTALMGGLVLATGADGIPQALATLGCFLVAGACFHVEEEKGGAA